MTPMNEFSTQYPRLKRTNSYEPKGQAETKCRQHGTLSSWWCDLESVPALQHFVSPTVCAHGRTHARIDRSIVVCFEAVLGGLAGELSRVRGLSGHEMSRV